MSVEQEPVRDRFPDSIPRRGEGVLGFSDSMIADLAINEALASGEKSFNLNNTVYNARKATCNLQKANATCNLQLAEGDYKKVRVQ